jgi:hypothetical protein
LTLSELYLKLARPHQQPLMRSARVEDARETTWNSK